MLRSAPGGFRSLGGGLRHGLSAFQLHAMALPHRLQRRPALRVLGLDFPQPRPQLVIPGGPSGSQIFAEQSLSNCKITFIQRVSASSLDLIHCLPLRKL